jgi:hypothetical protein
VSTRGVNLYELTQDLTQTWKSGELQKMQGHAGDNGKTYAVSVERGASEYRGVVNDKARTLPIEAFSNTLWHYGTVRHRLLFKQTDLDLRR